MPGNTASGLAAQMRQGGGGKQIGRRPYRIDQADLATGMATGRGRPELR